MGEYAGVVSGIHIGHESVLLLEIMFVRVLLGGRPTHNRLIEWGYLLFVVLLIASAGEASSRPVALFFLGFNVSHFLEFSGQGVVVPIVFHFHRRRVVMSFSGGHQVTSPGCSDHGPTVLSSTILHWEVVHVSVLFGQCA